MEISSQDSLHPDLHILKLENFEETFSETIEQLNQSKDEWTFSHKIQGRWENTYVPIDSIPAARQILNLATKAASKTFGRSLVCIQGVERLIKESFWFNLMDEGHSTGWHNHKARAHASGVCYLQIPEDSGKFRYRDREGTVHCYTPCTGTILLFPSTLNHSVETNVSDQLRISMAFNLYTLPLSLDPEDDPFGGNLFFK